MGLEHKTKMFFNFASSITPKEIFYLFTYTLLSLLLPLSFLLLAKISEAQYYLQRFSFWNQRYYYSSPQHFPYVLTLALYIIPFILYFILIIITIVSLINAFTGKITILSDSSYSSTNFQPRIYIAWILLCVFQVCVGLGIEGSILVGLYDSDYSFGVERSFLSRVVFLLGLHETTRVWARMVVRPVLDDTVLGGVVRKERWVERVCVALCLGSLWWWKLRDDVENLVVMCEAKKEQLMDVGINDFVGWCLYYLTVIIGMVKVVKGLLWIMAMVCPCTREMGISLVVPGDNDDKV
ncbi:uncharacterized protein [Cicer arietinum]|uniref:Uncharacterized protein LOC101494771 n=1 Tax=Cicer arietinum TaxID=3827 RepID=A0A1S2XWB3_CICAR|nr:uncharacterized protein LOC101494771 [Cicer arietinum]